jgi:hypothetical protein
VPGRLVELIALENPKGAFGPARQDEHPDAERAVEFFFVEIQVDVQLPTEILGPQNGNLRQLRQAFFRRWAQQQSGNLPDDAVGPDLLFPE